MMDVVNYSDFRKGLAKYLDKVDTDKGPLLITRQNSKPAVLMSLDEFNAYEETLYLLKSPNNATRLRRSVDAVKSGQLLDREISFDDEVEG